MEINKLDTSDPKKMSNGAALAFGMGKKSDEEPMEEMPAMRAVALMSQPADLQFSGSTAGKFGKLPSLGISRPAPLSGGGGDLTRSTSLGLSVRKEWNESNWKVEELELVPIDFPLERTHREIQDTDANDVAKRISKALCKLSVDAEYDGENAKAKCTTSDMVSFRIRLFAGGEGGLPVVVEVQRRSGSPSSFMRVCRQILSAAEGLEVTPVCEPPRKKMPPFMKGPVGSMKCLQGISKKTDHHALATNELNKSMELLRSKQKDSNVLGLENLCLLTDPLKTCPIAALKACKDIITSESCAEIREELGVVLQKDAFLPEEFDDDDALKSLFHKSHQLALVLLSNVLSMTSKEGCLAPAVATEKWFADFLIPTLLDEVKSFESSANTAYEAACGLTSLAACSDVAKRVMESYSAVDDLTAAYNYGLHNHELLANEAERSLNAMGKSVEA